MRNIFADIKTAVKLTGEIRKARKAGASAVQLKPVYTVPAVTHGPAWPDTIEGCLAWKLGREADRAVMEVFRSFPYEVQRQLAFVPKKPGEWVERAQFWQRELKPALPPKMYRAAMVLFINWYAHCLRGRRETAA